MRDDNKTFFNLEVIIILVMGIVTLIEAFKLEWFSKFFLLVKPYVSWFIGISFGFVFKNVLSPFKKRLSSHQGFIKNKENFVFFILNLIIIAVVVSTIQKVVVTFFNSFLIYFHVLVFQWIMLIYIFFKLGNNYEISKKYLITNEVIILVYTILILYLIYL
jgi:cation transport ATPase